MMNNVRRFLGAAVAVAVLASCGGDGGETTGGPGATTSMPPVSTTVASAPGAAESAWATFVQSYETLDVSKVSDGPCGPRGVIVTEGSVTTYWWDGVRWSDDTSMLDGGKGNKPAKVHTHDFTNDGVDDFLVVYEDNLKRTGNLYVAILGYPWVESEQCKWRWMDIDNGLDTNKRFEITSLDVRTWTIRGLGYDRRRLVRGHIAYLPASSAFVFQPSTGK